MKYNKFISQTQFVFLRFIYINKISHLDYHADMTLRFYASILYVTIKVNFKHDRLLIKYIYGVGQ